MFVLNSFEGRVINVILLMKKRTSTKEGYFETIRGQNQSLGSPSPVKAPLHR